MVFDTLELLLINSEEFSAALRHVWYKARVASVTYDERGGWTVQEERMVRSPGTSAQGSTSQNSHALVDSGTKSGGW